MEAIQTVRTILVVEVEGLRRDLESAKKDTRELGGELANVKHDLEALSRPTPGKAIAADLRLAENAARDLDQRLAQTASSARRMAPIVVQSGETNTNPNAFLKNTQFGMGAGQTPALGFGPGREMMAAPWMTAELDRMRATAAATRPTIQGLGSDFAVAGRSAATATGSTTGFVSSLSKGTSVVGTISEVASRLALVASAGYLVVEAVDAIDRKFNRSRAINAEYRESIKDLNNELQRLADFGRDVDVALGKKAPLTTTQEKRREIEGTEFKPGEWESLNDKMLKAARETERLVGLASKWDIKIDPMGRVLPGQSSEDSASGKYKAFKELESLPSTLGNLVKFSGELAGMEKQGAELRAREMWEAAFTGPAGDRAVDTAKTAVGKILDAFTGPLSQFAFGLDRAGGIVAAPFAHMLGARNPLEAWLEEKLKDKDKDKKHPVHADMRGSKIYLTTRLETNDPARFADVALKSAFLGATARPLSAVMGLGSPPLANGRSR
ncbi:MAG: hypothetical protein JNJ59_15015 [Deltaproteobacteria bacterium]|nr:hypothetical protein [Deltaproteobacteria bacterium]